MNHNKILEKCLEELRKDAPRKDYVIGMLETLVEMGGHSAPVVLTRVHEDPLPIPEFPVVTTPAKPAAPTLTDEEIEFARKMHGPVAAIG